MCVSSNTKETSDSIELELIQGVRNAPDLSTVSFTRATDLNGYWVHKMLS
jgi:hypothetical protein